MLEAQVRYELWAAFPGPRLLLPLPLGLIIPSLSMNWALCSNYHNRPRPTALDGTLMGNNERHVPFCQYSKKLPDSQSPQANHLGQRKCQVTPGLSGIIPTKVYQ